VGGVNKWGVDTKDVFEFPIL